MAYDSLDRTLTLRVSVLISGTWYEIPGRQIVSATITQLTSSKSTMSMGEFCRNKLELKYLTGELLYPGDSTFPSDSTYPGLSIAWGNNRQLKVSISESDSDAVELGRFFVSGSEISTKDAGKSYTIVGYDTPNSMNDVYPIATSSTDVSAILTEIETHTGMTIVDKDFSLKTIESVPTNTTYAGLLGYIAGYDGKNLRVNNAGEIETYWYDTKKSFTITRKVQLQGEFTDRQSVPGINAIVSGSGSDNTISVGSGSAVVFTNPYIDETQLNAILNRVKGFSYNYGSVKWRGNPAVRAGDTVLIETSEGVTATFPIMENTIAFDGSMTFTSVGHTYVQESTVLGSTSPTQRKLEIVYHKLNNALKNATELMKGGEGGYYKLLTDEAGKPYGFQIADADPITTTTNGWIFTNNGLFHSSDGFQTVSSVAITMHGHIVGNYVDTGIISDGDGTSGANWWNLDTGEIHIGNSNVVTVDDGAIASVITYWLQTESSSIPDKSDEAWSEIPSVFKPGYHVWRMTKTTYVNPTQSPAYSDPVEITSPEVVKVTNYYRLSASKDKLYGWLYPSNSTFPSDETYPSDTWSAEWHTEYPEWKAGYYLWTKTLLTYADGTEKWTNPVVNTEFTNVTSIITSYNTKFEETDKAISLKADSSTVNSYYNTVLNQIAQEKTDRSAEIKETADSINASVKSVSEATVRDMKIQYKTSVSKDTDSADGYLYPSDSAFPGEETYPTLPITSDSVWTDYEPTPVAGHYLWRKYILTYFDEDTQKNVTKEFIRLGELESSAYNRTVNNSASVDVLNNSVGINASRIETLNDEVSSQNAKFNVAYNEITSEVSKKVGEDEVISKINQSPEAISIQASKIHLEGIVTANKGFQIDSDGSMIATNGTFSGSVTSTTKSEGGLVESGVVIDDGEIRTFPTSSTIGSVLSGWALKFYGSTSSDVGNTVFGSIESWITDDSRNVLGITVGDTSDFSIGYTKDSSFYSLIGFSPDSNGAVYMSSPSTDYHSETGISITNDSILLDTTETQLYESGSAFVLYNKSGDTAKPRLSLYGESGTLTLYNSSGNGALYIDDTLRLESGDKYFGPPVVGTGGDSFEIQLFNGLLYFYVDGEQVSNNTSDMHLKKNIKPISDDITDAIGLVDIKQYQMKDKPFDTDEIHYGVLAQSIIKNLKEHNVNPDTQHVVYKMPRDSSKDSKEVYAVDKEEFLMARIAYDEKRISELEERIEKLEALLTKEDKE